MMEQKVKHIRKIPANAEKLGTLSDIEKMLNRNTTCPHCETIYINGHVPRCKECEYEL